MMVVIVVIWDIYYNVILYLVINKLDLDIILNSSLGISILWIGGFVVPLILYYFLRRYFTLRSLQTSEKIHINAEIVSITAGVEERGKGVKVRCYVLNCTCEDGHMRESERNYEGEKQVVTDIDRGKLVVGMKGTVIIRVDKHKREKVTGFLPGFDAQSGEVTSNVIN